MTASAEIAEGLRRVHAAVVELDALPDPVRAGAEDDDARPLADGRRLARLAPGRVVVARCGIDLAGARVDAAIGRPDAELVPPLPHFLLCQPERRADCRVAPAGLRAQEIHRSRRSSRARSSSARNRDGRRPGGRRDSPRASAPRARAPATRTPSGTPRRGSVRSPSPRRRTSSASRRGAVGAEENFSNAKRGNLTT